MAGVVFRVRRFAAALFLWVFCSAVFAADAQAPTVPPPDVGQPDNYSHLIGRYTITASAKPTDVFVEEAIVLTVMIQWAGTDRTTLPDNDYQPTRKHLKIFPDDMSRYYYIGDLPKDDSFDAMKRIWTFHYQLLPKNEKVAAIPPLELMYYDPNARPQPRYEPSITNAIPIKVKVRPLVKVAPERMYHIGTGEAMLRRTEPGSVNWLLAALGLVLPPAGSILGYRLWRHHHPGQAGQRQRRQSRAARQALRKLRLLSKDPDGSRSGNVLTRFLHARLDLQPADPTPLEVRLHLWKAGFSAELTDRLGDYFQAVVENRFAPLQNDTTKDPRAEAAWLIQAVEEESL
jgi:hypothetical protein